jgi:hypothetical protein
MPGVHKPSAISEGGILSLSYKGIWLADGAFMPFTTQKMPCNTGSKDIYSNLGMMEVLTCLDDK